MGVSVWSPLSYIQVNTVYMTGDTVAVVTDSFRTAVGSQYNTYGKVTYDSSGNAQSLPNTAPPESSSLH